MLRKSAILAVAASAAFGLVALNPVSASAHGGGHGGGGHGGGGHWGGGHWGGGYHHFHYGWHRPIFYARPVVYAARPVTVSAPGPCTCLSKEYTPEGAVLFKDRCTNEMAMNPPPAPPQQTGSLEPQSK